MGIGIPLEGPMIRHGTLSKSPKKSTWSSAGLAPLAQCLGDSRCGNAKQQTNTPWKINIAMGNPPFEDVSPIKDGFFSIAMLVYQRVHLGKLTWNPKKWRWGR